jgi:hypothetical protein
MPENLPFTPVDMPVEAPGELRRLFRFGKLAVRGDRTTEQIFELLLQDLRDSGVPQEAINSIEQKGVGFLRRGSVASSVEKLAGTPENVQQVKSSLRAARASVRGVSPKMLQREFDDFLKALVAESPEGLRGDAQRIVEELKRLGPKRLSELGSRTVTSALVTRGDQPLVANLLRKAVRKAPYPAVAESIKVVLEQTGGIPAVGEAPAGLAAAGVGGFSKGAGFGRKALGMLGKGAGGPIGLGIGAALIAPRVMDVLGRGGRAREMARTGFGALGPQSSAEYLRERINAQETLTRRKMVMTKFEPQLFNEVLRVLATEGVPEGSLTTTERQIGTPRGGAVAGQRTSQDVQFLLDHLLSQMGQ